MNNEIMESLIDDFRSNTGEFEKIRVFSDKNCDNLEEAIISAYSALDTREKKIISLRIYNKLTFKSIGDLNNNITSSRAREIFMKSMRKLDRNISNYTKFENDKNVMTVFTTRTGHILSRNGYNCVNDLAGIKYADFMKYREAGQNAWNEIKNYMDMYNIPYYDIEFDYDVMKSRLDRTIINIIYKYKMNEEIVAEFEDDIQDHIIGIMNDLFTIFKKTRGENE